MRQYGRLIGATVGALCRKKGAWYVDEDEMKSHVYEMLLSDDCRRLRAWRGDSKLSTYLVQVTRNLCIDYFRKHNRGPDRVDADMTQLAAEPDVTAVADSDEFGAKVKALSAAIERLSTKQALIVKMRLTGTPLRDIAEHLHMPKGTVFAENSRAMKKLRERLESDDVFAHGPTPA